MNVEIYLEMIPKVDIRITIYSVPIHPSPVPELGHIAAKCPKNGTEKRQKIRGIRESRCQGSKEYLICRGARSGGWNGRFSSIIGTVLPITNYARNAPTVARRAFELR